MTQRSNAGSDRDGAGRSGSDRGTSEHSISGSRKEAERQQGANTPAKLSRAQEQSQDADETSTRSRSTEKPR